ncbi:MAG: HPr family phosphocarrier protein [Phycisphaerae bacterium]|nr:HPr family phosphocarrier protein [Phycisphaerae bacterium]
MNEPTAANAPVRDGGNHTHVEREVEICNAQGLHARPVMRFVDLASQFESTVRVHKGNISVDGKSPMEMMLLEATRGTRLRLVGDGADAAAAVESLARLIEDKFFED